MTSFNLKHYKTTRINEATHLEMCGKEGGKFKIPLNKKEELYKFVEKNPKYCVTERPTSRFPLYFDIDNLDKDLNIEKIIDETIISNINKILDTEKVKNGLIYYTLNNKSKPNYYHIHFPKLIVNYRIAVKIAKTINQEKNIVDLSVYKNGLRLFKTLKPSKKNSKKIEENSYYQFMKENARKKTFDKQIKIVSIQIDNNTELTPLNPDVKFDDNDEKEEKKVDNDKLSQYCNELTGLKYKWRSELKPGKDNQYILSITDSPICIAQFLKDGDRHMHNQENHSCIYIGKNSATASCLNHAEHGSYKLPTTEGLRKIKALLGLIKNANDLNDYEQLQEELVNYAFQRKYKRSGGYVMKLKDDCPILYVRYCLYRDFLNEVFTYTNNNYYYRLYRKAPNNHQKLLTYLETYEDKKFNFVKINPHIIAFKDGYLDISELYNLKFIKYTDMPAIAPTTTVYHDYIFNPEWLKNLDLLKTPKFDRLINYHIQDDSPDNHKQVYEIFLGMAGRLHYPINTYDRFNCMLYLIGSSNSGKSTAANILLNNHQNVGSISSKMEDTFGLESFVEHNNSLIFCPDMPQNFHKKLDKATFQRMIEGSCVSVSRKNKIAINDYEWVAPSFFVGNYFPGYSDSSGAIPRRLCVFRMNKLVVNRYNGFERECKAEESHLILLKSLYYYKQLIEQYGDKTYEDWNIDYFKESYDELMLKCNYVYNFLTLAPGDFDYWPIYEKGAELPLKGKNGFVKKYERYLFFKKRGKKWVKDTTTLGRLGFKLITIRICANCSKKYNPQNTEPCCDGFTVNNLRKKDFILNMKIRHEDECDMNNSDDSEE